MVEMIEDTSEFVKHLCCRHVFFSPRTAFPSWRCNGGERVSRFRLTCKAPRMLVHHQDDMKHVLGGFGALKLQKGTLL